MRPQTKPKRSSFGDPGMMNLKQSLLSAESLRKSQIKTFKSKKIIVLGLKNTGKTTLVLKFLYDFCGLEEATSEENYSTALTYKDETFQLNIVDVADFDEYTHLYPAKFSLKVDGYIFLYSVDDPNSFQFVQTLREKLFNMSSKYLPSILVANKCDITSNRQISQEEGRKLAWAYRVPYKEISAINYSSDAIKRVFETMLEEVLRSEEQTNSIKWLKNWERSKVEDLYHLFFLANLLLAIIGLFFMTFVIANLLMYPSLIADQGYVLVCLVLEGFLLMIICVVGWYGMKREEKEWMAIFSLILGINILFAIGIIALKIMTKLPEIPSNGGRDDNIATEYVKLDPIIYGVIIITLLVMILLFFIAHVSNEIFIKRQSVRKSRFASLRA